MNIITQLQGGLGNQLFQYATARNLAIQKGVPLLLDSDWYCKIFKDVTPRDLLLPELNIAESIVFCNPNIKKPKRLRRISQKFLPLDPFIFIEKTPYHFDPFLSHAPAFQRQNLYLMGYWQSFKYFESIRSMLQNEVTPAAPLSRHYLAYLEKIEFTNSAMVHVRRGDYFSLATANRVHGIITLDYYIQGMNLLLNRNQDIQFFVFSDDLDWAKKNLPHQERLVFIEPLGTKNSAIQELELMKHCKNHLIANSSLSWWGAWLRKNTDGIVICPKSWTNDLTMNWNDLLPTIWMRL